MKSILKSDWRAVLLVSMAFLAGCNAQDQRAGEDPQGGAAEENVGVARSADSDLTTVQQFFTTRQSSPPISQDRGTGVVPSVCPSGQTAVLGVCWWSFAAASCPSWQEEDAGLCYSLCPSGYSGAGPTCWLNTIDQAMCQSLYSPTLAAGAMQDHRARTFGIGAGMAAFASQSYEGGVFYGENGEYGCYTNVCNGVETNVALDMYGSFGDYDSLAVIEGSTLDLSVGVDIEEAGYTQSYSLLDDNVVGFVQEVSLGASVSPITLGVSSCNTTLTTLQGPAYPGGDTFYHVAPDGALQMSHRMSNDAFDMVNQTIGSGWGVMSKVFAAGGGHVYGIDGQGNLIYYHHDSAGNWDNGGTTIGNGWGVFTTVLAAQFGEIYAIEPNGNLLLYRHDAAFHWNDASGTVVGAGWNSLTVFTGGPGTLHVIDAGGHLYYYHIDAANQWTQQALQIGVGWNEFATVGSTGEGEIFGVTPAGDMQIYHLGSDLSWGPGSGLRIGTGWSFGSDGLIPAVD